LHLFSQIAKSAQSQGIIADAKGRLVDYRRPLTWPSGSILVWDQPGGELCPRYSFQAPPGRQTARPCWSIAADPQGRSL